MFVQFSLNPTLHIKKMWTLSLKPADVPGSAVPAILVGLFVSSGGVLFGYAIDTYLVEERRLTDFAQI